MTRKRYGSVFSNYRNEYLFYLTIINTILVAEGALHKKDLLKKIYQCNLDKMIKVTPVKALRCCIISQAVAYDPLSDRIYLPELDR